MKWTTIRRQEELAGKRVIVQAKDKKITEIEGEDSVGKVWHF